MKRYGILWYALSTAAALSLAACGGGGGGGGGAGNANPEFTNAIALQGPAGATTSSATSINNPVTGSRLEVVGMADDAANPGVLQPMVWDFAPNAIAVQQVPPVPPSVTPTPPNGVLAADLVPEDLPNLAAGEFGAAFGNNNLGEIVGQSEDITVGGIVQAVLWSPEPATGPRTVTALDPAVPSAAFDINNNGLVVGEREATAGVLTPVVYDSDAVPVAPVALPLGTTGATAGSAYFISENDVIVGELTIAGATKAVVWKPITTTPARTDYEDPILLIGIPATPATPTAPAKPALDGDSVALAVLGTNGPVVGEITDAATGIVHAVRWQTATATAIPQDLGANSTIGGINNNGRMVGSANNAASAWAPGTAAVTMHATLVEGRANAINNNTRAVGIAGGQAFFATP